MGIRDEATGDAALQAAESRWRGPGPGVAAPDRMRIITLIAAVGLAAIFFDGSPSRLYTVECCAP